jgi:hypothetical protein
MADDPGSRFLYCSGCSHLLSAAVVRVDRAGYTLNLPINICLHPWESPNITWETDPHGIAVGGWGLEFKPSGYGKTRTIYTLTRDSGMGSKSYPRNGSDRASKSQIETGGNLRLWISMVDLSILWCVHRHWVATASSIFVIPASEYGYCHDCSGRKS